MLILLTKGLKRASLWKYCVPILILFISRNVQEVEYCLSLSTRIVQFLILPWHGFNHVKILEWNVNKFAIRLRAKVGVESLSVLY